MTEEQLVAKIFEKYGATNIKVEEYVEGLRSRPDLQFELEGQKYIVEIKKNRGKFFRQDLLFNAFFQVHGHLEKLDAVPLVVFFNEVDEKVIGKTHVIDIGNLLYMSQNDAVLLDGIRSIVDYSIANVELRKPEFPIGPLSLPIGVENSKSDLRQAEIDRLLEKLKNVACGREAAKEYELVCEEILKILFTDNIQFFHSQTSTKDRLNIFDNVVKIKYDNSSPFWNVLRKCYHTEYVIFEYKNYCPEITQHNIWTTYKYLYKSALRNVAIIISRKGEDDHSRKVMDGILRDEGKLILSLSDESLEKMLSMKGAGNDPSDHLQDLFDQMMIKLER